MPGAYQKQAAEFREEVARSCPSRDTQSSGAVQRSGALRLPSGLLHRNETGISASAGSRGQWQRCRGQQARRPVPVCESLVSHQFQVSQSPSDPARFRNTRSTVGTRPAGPETGHREGGHGPAHEPAPAAATRCMIMRCYAYNSIRVQGTHLPSCRRTRRHRLLRRPRHLGSCRVDAREGCRARAPTPPTSASTTSRTSPPCPVAPLRTAPSAPGWSTAVRPW